MAQFDPANDPFREREQATYDQPIVSREYILDCLTHLGVPVSLTELATKFGYDSEELEELLSRRLRAMEKSAQVLRDRKNRYALIEHLNLKKGKVHGHRDGYGFVSFVDSDEDWYISARQMKKAFHGDEVLVRPDGQSFKGRTEAFIVRVLSELELQLVGRFHSEANTHFVIPEDPRYPEYIHIDMEID